MSIAALKRKSQVLYNNLSVGSNNGFSLNGTHRSQGYIGQSVASRHLVRSLAKGPTLRGHGGCCGTYPVKNTKASELIGFLNDTNVVKESVGNTSGMLRDRYKYLLGGDQHVKPDSNQHMTCSLYTNKLGKKAAKCAEDSYSLPEPTVKTCNTLPSKALIRRYVCDLLSGAKTRCYTTKPPFKNKNGSTAGLSQSAYLEKLSETCNLEKPVGNSCNGCPLPGN